VIDIFSSNTLVSINFVTASKLCESLCRYGKSQDIYEKLKKEIEEHVLQMKAELLSIPVNIDILSRLSSSWNTFCSQLSIIRNVFMELDRSYILPTTRFSSIM
jgi:cullin-4